MTDRIATLLGCAPEHIEQTITDLLDALEEEVTRRRELERDLAVCESAMMRATMDAAQSRGQAVELARLLREARQAPDRGRTNTKTRVRK